MKPPYKGSLAAAIVGVSTMLGGTPAAANPTKAPIAGVTHPTKGQQLALNDLLQRELGAQEEAAARQKWLQNVNASLSTEEIEYAKVRAEAAAKAAVSHKKAQEPGFYGNFAQQAQANIVYILTHTNEILADILPIHILQKLEKQTQTIRQNVLVYTLVGFHEDRKEKAVSQYDPLMRMVAVDNTVWNRKKNNYRGAENAAQVAASLVQYTFIGTKNIKELIDINHEKVSVKKASTAAFYTELGGDKALSAGVMSENEVADADHIRAVMGDCQDYLTGEAAKNKDWYREKIKKGYGIMQMDDHIFLIPPTKEQSR